MRIEQLSLVNYGAFAARTLDLRSAPGLAIVYGPNEAGKSTCLSATLDFLFGIPHNSPHGGLFGYDKMRLDGTIRAADGALVSLRRRKGKAGKTLLSADGSAGDEELFGRVFGAFTRERYRALFALDHALLRSGGEALLKSSGEIGQLIVEAGGGLSQLLPLMAELDREAETLYAPRAAKERAFYKALSSLEAATRGIRESTLTRESYELAEGKVRDIASRIAALRDDQLKLRARIAQAERLLRVSPLLLELDPLEEAIVREGEVALPSATWLAQVHNALAEASANRTLLRTAEQAHTAAEERVLGVAVDTLLLSHAPLLTLLEEQRSRLAVLREREPTLRDELLRVHALLARRSAGPMPATFSGNMQAFRDALEALQARGSQLRRAREQQRAALERVDEDRAEEGAAAMQCAARVASGYDRPFPLDLTPLTELVAVAEASARMDQQLASDERRAELALQALGFEDSESLRSALLPPLELARELVDGERRAAESEGQRRLQELDLARREKGAEQRLRALSEHSQVPSAGQLDAARCEREQTWRSIRAEYLEVAPTADPLLTRAERAERAELFQQHTVAADRLADGLASAATQVAEARVCTREIEAVQSERASLAARADAAAGHWLARRSAVFDELRGLPAAITSPLALLSVVERRGQLLDGYSELARRRDECHRLRGRTESLRTLLAHAEALLQLNASEALSLSVRVSAVQARARAHDAAHSEHTRALREEATRAPVRAQRAALAARYTREFEVAEAEFRDALAKLGLPAGSGEADLASRVKELRESEAAEAESGRLIADLSEIADAESALSGTLQKLAALSVAADEAQASPTAAATLLQRRFADAQRAAEHRRGLVDICTVAATQLRGAREADARSQRDLAELAAAAGIGVEALRDYAARAERVQALVKARDAALLRTSQAGDGHAVAELRAELSERDVSLLRAELPTLALALKQSADESDAELVALVHAEAELRSYAGESTLNQLHAAREAASTELNAAVERYLELRLTRELLGQAVERVRIQQRDPLVSRASALFALATEAAFVRIDTEVSREGEPVVFGVRANGNAVPLHEMSDGTRDQLFLAFRLASVEHYCRAREPLPFIGDDLLVHFDDARSSATLTLLAELGQTTQVLLFTHHRSVCDAAAPLLKAGLAQVVSLSTPA